MPPATFDRPPTPWDADDRSLFVPVSRFRRLFGGRFAALWAWRRRWTP